MDAGRSGAKRCTLGLVRGGSYGVSPQLVQLELEKVRDLVVVYLEEVDIEQQAALQLVAGESEPVLADVLPARM